MVKTLDLNSSGSSCTGLRRAHIHNRWNTPFYTCRCASFRHLSLYLTPFFKLSWQTFIHSHSYFRSKKYFAFIFFLSVSVLFSLMSRWINLSFASRPVGEYLDGLVENALPSTFWCISFSKLAGLWAVSFLTKKRKFVFDFRVLFPEILSWVLTLRMEHFVTSWLKQITVLRMGVELWIPCCVEPVMCSFRFAHSLKSICFVIAGSFPLYIRLDSLSWTIDLWI